MALIRRAVLYMRTQAARFWAWLKRTFEDPRADEVRWLRGRVEELEGSVERLKVSGAEYIPQAREETVAAPRLPPEVADAIRKRAGRGSALEDDLTWWAMEQLDVEMPPDLVARRILDGAQTGYIE